jgi:urea transport system permease protein
VRSWARCSAGISLGSILLLVALGLAITYGLMGVINMAHGELMMIGAYATYVVQCAVPVSTCRAPLTAYLLAAVPASFLAAGCGGCCAGAQRCCAHLYGRPLETLLATWGISLVLMQAVRTVFGAQNVGVENPSLDERWRAGAGQLVAALQPLGRSSLLRCAVLGGHGLVDRQNASGLVCARRHTKPAHGLGCMGVNTARIDTYAFALGSRHRGLGRLRAQPDWQRGP